MSGVTLVFLTLEVGEGSNVYLVHVTRTYM